MLNGMQGAAPAQPAQGLGLPAVSGQAPNAEVAITAEAPAQPEARMGADSDASRKKAGGSSSMQLPSFVDGNGLAQARNNPTGGGAPQGPAGLSLPPSSRSSLELEEHVALDGMLQSFLQDGDLSQKEMALYQQVRGLFTSSPGAAPQPAAPAPGAPAKPEPAAPAKPEAAAPAKPKAVAPAKPEAVAPAKPEAAAPAKPEAVAPAKPEAVAPAKPGQVSPLSPLLPFDQMPPEKLRQYPRKVFAHYFPPYPISLNNQAPEKDYYARHYLNPHGENDKWLSSGGLLRDRPLPRAPLSGDWMLEDMKTEVDRAQALGIDGFAVDILTTPSTRDKQQWNRVVKLLEAAGASNTSFRIMPMLDVAGGLGESEAKAASSFQEIFQELIRLEKASGKKRLNYLDDGRLAITVFKAERFSPAFWQAQIDRLYRETGVKAAFMPCFVKKQSPAELQAYADMPSSFGLSRWGPRTPGAASSEEPKQMRKYHDQWMAPVAPQDTRPKSGIYEDAENSKNYRAMWEAAIAGSDDDDWVQLITWNDYSEHSEISPSTATGHAFYDLTAYYLQWFKTGKQPEIKRDVLYYFHRNQPASALPDPKLQATPFRNKHGDARTKDNIEVLGFLKNPGTLAIEVAGRSATKQVPAGIQSFTVPVKPGTPKFQLLRDGKTAVEVTSKHPIRAKVATQDFMYHAGGSTR